MRTIYLDCSMGAAGDMLTAALLELLPERQEFFRIMEGLHLSGVEISTQKSVKCGITGTHVSVKIDDVEEDEHIFDHHDHGEEHVYHHGHGGKNEHVHRCRGMAGVLEILNGMPLPEKVREDAADVYRQIAEAESKAHDMPMDEIHFHEVGTMDAIVDVVSVCLLMNMLKPEQVIASAVHVGSGTVHCVHGILPVPAPATAYILKGVPIYSGTIQGELCTPTGAALLKHFVTRFGELPIMEVSTIGFGMGNKDFPQANCVRSLLGETRDQASDVLELSCNIDDMTSEAIGFAMECFMDAGALDAYTQAIGMKKGRPGTKISVLCREADSEKMAREIFHYTTTLGIRTCRFSRYELNRTISKVDTAWGTIRRKESSGYDVSRCKYEYEDLATLAKFQGRGVNDVLLDLLRKKTEA